MFTLIMSLRLDLCEMLSVLRGGSSDRLAEIGLDTSLFDKKEEPLDLTSSMN